jgi:16S rRNA (cytosine967-C5)-methyltransferase
VLDACAAPGGKTTHLAALMHNEGAIVALDQNARRLALLEENCRRLGIRIVTAVAGDAVETAVLVPGRRFDRILLDAPCSGLGILRRHPEGKWQKDAARFPLHQQRQRRLLDAVSALLRPGGCLVYSTCSTEPEENEQVVDLFCRQHADFHRESVAPSLPSKGQALVSAQGDFSSVFNPFSMDGFFAAKLRKGQD